MRRRKVGSKEKTPSLLLTPIADADAAAVESAVEKSYQAMRVATFHLYEYYKTRHWIKLGHRKTENTAPGKWEPIYVFSKKFVNSLHSNILWRGGCRWHTLTFSKSGCINAIDAPAFRLHWRADVRKDSRRNGRRLALSRTFMGCPPEKFRSWI